jgi:hypothetical protein
MEMEVRRREASSSVLVAGGWEVKVMRGHEGEGAAAEAEAVAVAGGADEGAEEETVEGTDVGVWRVRASLEPGLGAMKAIGRGMDGSSVEWER